MPTFAIIRPRLKTIEIADCTDYKVAVERAGLKIGELDFGTVVPLRNGGAISIIVFEFGLMKDKGDPEGYFALNKSLYNGNAVLFTSDIEGETVDFYRPLANFDANGQPHLASHIDWLGNAQEVEEQIALGALHRPQTVINGEVIWSWKGDF